MNTDATNIKNSGSSQKNELRALVRKRAGLLQRDYLGSRTSALARARRDLANLRNAATVAPGTEPSIWDLTITGVTDGSTSDYPTKEEWAVHLALTLFAIHQQSRSEPMHIDGKGLGQAIALLERRSGDYSGNRASPLHKEPSPIRRRFNMVVTSRTLPELSNHLRGLVRQFRAKEIPLDYGQLASDLFEFQIPGGADSVRLRWARQYSYLE